MNFQKKTSATEKAMLAAILFLLIMIALNWGRISESVKKAIEPYNTTTTK